MLRPSMDMISQETADPSTPPTSVPISPSPPTKHSASYKPTPTRKLTPAPLRRSSHIHDWESKVAGHASLSYLGTSAYPIREPRIRPSNQPCLRPCFTSSTSSSFDLSSSEWPSLQQSLTFSSLTPQPWSPRLVSSLRPRGDFQPMVLTLDTRSEHPFHFGDTHPTPRVTAFQSPNSSRHFAITIFTYIFSLSPVRKHDWPSKHYQKGSLSTTQGSPWHRLPTTTPLL